MVGIRKENRLPSWRNPKDPALYIKRKILRSYFIIRQEYLHSRRAMGPTSADQSSGLWGVGGEDIRLGKVWLEDQAGRSSNHHWASAERRRARRSPAALLSSTPLRTAHGTPRARMHDVRPRLGACFRRSRPANQLKTDGWVRKRDRIPTSKPTQESDKYPTGFAGRESTPQSSLPRRHPASGEDRHYQAQRQEACSRGGIRDAATGATASGSGAHQSDRCARTIDVNRGPLRGVRSSEFLVG